MTARTANDSVDAPLFGRRPERLRDRRDFLAAARARSAGRPGFVLQARPRAGTEPAGPLVARLGLTASKKVGGAVTRNRAKRRLRALGQAALERLGRAGWDYVLIARRDGTVDAAFSTLAADLESALARVHAGPTEPRKLRRKPNRGGRV